MRHRCGWAAAVLIGAAWASAQPARRPGPVHEERLEAIVARISRMRLLELGDRLKLGDAELLKVARLDREYLTRRMQTFEARRRTAELLRMALQSEPPNNDRINLLLDELEAQEDQLYQLRKDELAELKRLLTPAQVAHYLIFDREFDRRLAQRMEQQTDRPAPTAQDW
ncbi:MAG TPA: hypothetical protein VGB99_15400 [Acidobacteriota bacterium]